MAQEQSKKQPAFDMDEVRSKSLTQASASDLLQALDRGGLHAGHLTLWPEKKKYELWVQPENYADVDVGRLIDVLRGEKKKVELEKFPGVEGWRDPRDQLINPVAVQLDQLADRLVRAVEQRLRG